MAEKRNTQPQLQNTSDIDTDVFVKGMTKDPDSSLITKEQWTHARNAINNSIDGDLGTLGNEPANKQCSSAPFTIIGAIHLYGDKWVLFSTNNEQSEIGTWDDSQCEYKRVVNDFTCYQCFEDPNNTGEASPFLNFSTQHLITGAAKENFDCSWQVYWDDGINPSRTLNLDNIPYKQQVVSEEGADCVIYENIEPLCLDTEKIRLAPLIDIPCIELSKSKDGGQLRNGSYQVFIAYTINDQKIGDYYGISNIQPLFEHEDMLSGLEINISNLDKQFEFFELVICSNNQAEQQAKQIGFYSTEQSQISIDYINQKLPSVPLSTLPLTTPAYEKSDKMYAVNDYLVRQGPTEQFDFNYQPLANQIHVHWTITEFPVDYYKKGGNKPTFMRDEQYAFFIRFVYNTGEKSASYHIPGPSPDAAHLNPYAGVQDAAGNNPNATDLWPGNNDLGTATWNNNNQLGAPVVDRVFEVFNTAGDGWTIPSTTMHPTLANNIQTGDGGRVIREGHMGYWESTERYPQDPVRWGDLCGQPIRHPKFPDETTMYQPLINDPTAVVGPNNPTDRTGQNNQTINVLGVRFQNIAWPRFNASYDQECSPDDPSPYGPRIPNIVGYEILVGSREGNKSIIAKGLARNMKQYNMPGTATGHEIGTGALTGFYPNYPFNDCGLDPFLHGGATNTWRGGGGIANPPGAIGTAGPNGTYSGYGAGNTSQNLYTFHSPETSFNKPFLSPYELKSYGICTGTSLGRFRPSEKHPQHKLLRNITMWIGILVGIGYAINEIRGKRNKKINRPRALSVGQAGTGDAHTGGGNLTLTPGKIALKLGTGGGPTTGGKGTWNRGGGRWRQAAPAIGNANGNLNITLGQRMMGSYVTSDITGSQQGTNAGLSAASVVGAPNIYKNLIYEPAMNSAMANWGANRGFIGAGQEIEFEGSRYEGLPGITQLFFGLYNFMAFTAEGGQVIIDLIYNLVSFQDYAWKYSGQGLYWSTQQIRSGSVFRQLVNKGRYIGSAMQNLTANIKINNVQRPKTVAVNTITNGADFNLPIQDNSRFTIGGMCGWFNPSAYQLRNIAAHYCSLKVNFRNQYGQLDQIKQIPTGCITYFKDQYEYDDKGEIVPWNDDNTASFQTPPIYGGDCYIGRYSEKIIMPFFWDFMLGQPDGFPYDYKLRANVPRPIYWMDTKKYELSELVRQIATVQFLIGGNTGPGLSAGTPSGLYFLDRPNGSNCGGPGGGPPNANAPNQPDWIADDGTGSAPGAGAGNTPTPNPIAVITANLVNNTGNQSAGAGPGPNATAVNAPQQDAPERDRGGRSIFHIKNGYMYTHCNGVNEFYAESTINVDLRDYEDTDAKRHFDIVEYTDVEALFHSEIIKKDNFYKYDSSLSKRSFNTQLISYGFIQPRDYDPLVAENCYTHYPKRLMYSLQAQLEAKKDFWRVFLPFNYKDFKNKVNVIKPVSKSGAMILFPHLSPVLWQGVDQLQTDLGTKLTIGDGGLFEQPQQAIVNADLPHEYGSCESARSVVNTPSGLFFISQAQGKIFQYTNGLVNIADQGMKQWFNKYLPSVLLSQFPEMEDCDSWIDNPVAGVGCQSVYDPNYDLVYFSKKDYECTLPECIEYVPCEGFVYNNSACNNYPQTPCCPDGFTYNPNNPAGEECERITTEPANIDERSGEVDIIFNVDSSNSISQNNNTGNVQNFVRTFIDLLQADNLITDGNVRVGFVHHGGGRATNIPLFAGQVSASTAGNAFDEMFEQSNQVPLTNDMTLINQWIGFPGAWNGNFYAADLSSIYGQATGMGPGTPTPPRDRPHGTDILGGIWCSQNLLYGLGARAVPKVLITIFDGPNSVATNNALYTAGNCNFFYTSTPFTQGGITGSDVYAPLGTASMQVPDPALASTTAQQTPDVDWGTTCPPTTTLAGFAATANSYDATWFDNNVRNGYTQDAPFNQKNYSIIVDPGGTAPTNAQEVYAERYAGGGGLTPQDGQFGGAFSDTTEIENIANSIIEQVTPPPVITCPPGCDLVTTAAGQYYCECREYVPATYLDNTTPISIDDKMYFKDVSWTVSYDPKYKAWMSFHDWHPQLMIPSLNHFFTTNTYEDLESEPNCPPGFTWNPTTQTCCQVFQGEFEADIVIDEVPVEFEVESIPCKIDIVLAVDSSGSMGLGNNPRANDNWNAAQSFINDFTFNLASEMIEGDIQIGLVHWSNPTIVPMFGGGTNPITNDTWPSVGNGNTETIGGTTYTYALAIVPDGQTGLSMTNNPRLVYDPVSGNAIGSDFAFDVNPQDGGATEMAPAYAFGQNQLWNVKGSALGDRTLDPGYRRIFIFIADGGDNGNPLVSNAFGYNWGATGVGVGQLHNPNDGGMITPTNTTVDPGFGNIGGNNTDAQAAGQQVFSQTFTIFASQTGANPGAAAGFNAIVNTNAYGNSPNQWNVDTSAGCDPLVNCPGAVANAITSGLCTLPPVCNCPPGYERISSNLDSTAPPHIVMSPFEDCRTEGKIGVCRKMECECNTDELPFPSIPTTQTGLCPTDIVNGIALYYNPDTNVGDATWTSGTYAANQLMCHYDYECCVEGTTTRGGIWKHNDRCDLFANYYGKDYPWEVEWVETVGQSVNTVRSIEYQLESYIYKGNLANNCGDRFHDLDWNFDEAIIHNTEQVSGLLKLNLDPKNNVPLITNYPIITGADIEILYSKVEQKYRFNQFWDITRDRGEFNPNFNSSIFITELNGYIRDLNQANLDYFKPQLERKKFRHYWNKIVLRKNVSGNRKMIFKLANTKINASFR